MLQQKEIKESKYKIGKTLNKRPELKRNKSTIFNSDSRSDRVKEWKIEIILNKIKIREAVKYLVLRSRKVDLVFFYVFFLFLFYFIFDLCSSFLFLELRVRVSHTNTRRRWKRINIK